MFYSQLIVKQFKLLMNYKILPNCRLHNDRNEDELYTSLISECDQNVKAR